MLKKLIMTATMAGLLASPIAAAAQPAPAQSPVRHEVAPAGETVNGQQLWEVTSPILIFLAIVGIGVAIALLVNTKDEPASP